jgi:probable HAF family extracellular repeat protein
MTDIGTLGGANSRARAINSSGQIVGGSQDDSGYLHAFAYDGTMTDLGTLGGRSSEAFAINDNGQITGHAKTGNYNHAFIYENNTMTDLGTLGGLESKAFDINSAGHIVGWANNSYYQKLAFIYDGSQMTALNSLTDPSAGWDLRYAYSINDSGQIVGQGINSSGEQHAFLLTPIPEPATICLLGLSGLLFHRKKTNCTRY